MTEQSVLNEVLINFSGAGDEPEWQAINDSVMGGRSEGAPAIRDGMLHFTGQISLANNGGFSSVRGRGQDYDLSSARGLILRVKGDGRTYQMRLYTSARYQSSRIAYGMVFPTRAGEWTQVEIPFAKLEPVYRGRKLSGPPFDPSDIQEIGFLLADKREGDFAFAVDWIKVDRDQNAAKQSGIKSGEQ